MRKGRKGEGEKGGEGAMMNRKLRSHRDLEVYQLAFSAAMRIFETSRKFPREETYSLTDQVRRSSRSVCANITEAWRKRIYEAAFVSKISDAETEAAETQVWLEFAVKCGYLQRPLARDLYKTYESIVAMLVTMRNSPESWILPGKASS
jgi:four helix bundle protein